MIILRTNPHSFSLTVWKLEVLCPSVNVGLTYIFLYNSLINYSVAFFSLQIICQHYIKTYTLFDQKQIVSHYYVG